MADIIGNIISDKQEIKNQIGTVPDVISSLKRFSKNIRVEHLVTKIIDTNISGAMIWGSDTFGEWGESNWGNDVDKSFVLNSSTQGILGSNILGDATLQPKIYAVLPKDNQYRDYFDNDEYINTSKSTGTLSTSAGTYTLSDGEVLETEVICKLRSSISNCTIVNSDELVSPNGLPLPFTLGVDVFEEDTVRLYVSNDSGLTFHEVEANERFVFPSSSNDDELKVRIVSRKNDIVVQGPLVVNINT